MFINDILKTATIILPNFGANAALGTAATTVDRVSSFVITQTTANIAVTIPTPTNAIAGDRLIIGNSTASTQAITVAGVRLLVGEFAIWIWSGTAWLFQDGGRNTGASVSIGTAPAGTLNVTHGLALPTGSFSSYIYRAYDSTGQEIVFRRNKAGDTTNVASFTLPVAITTNLPIVFDFTPLA